MLAKCTGERIIGAACCKWKKGCLKVDRIFGPAFYTLVPPRLQGVVFFPNSPGAELRGSGLDIIQSQSPRAIKPPFNHQLIQ